MLDVLIGNLWAALGLASLLCLFPILAGGIVLAGLVMRARGQTEAQRKRARARGQQAAGGCLPAVFARLYLGVVALLFALSVCGWWAVLSVAGTGVAESVANTLSQYLPGVNEQTVEGVLPPG